MKILTNTGLAALWNKIKTALAGKADKSHTHTKSQITDFVHTHDSSTSLISGYVATNASLSSYKAPLLTMDIPNDSNNMNYILVLMVEYTTNSRNGYGFIALHIRKNDNNIIQYVRLFEISGNSWDMLSAYYNASTMKVELWGDLLRQWGCMRYTVLSWGANMYSKPEHLPSFITFSPSVFDTVQTPPSGFTEVACTRIGAAEIANKDILGNVINTTYLTTTGSNGTANGVSALINKLETGSATPTDNDYYVSQYVGGAQQTYHRRPMSALWSYIKGKANSVYALINHTHTKSQITDFVTHIGANANLNDYQTAGMYWANQNTDVQTMSNCPTTQAFSLLVEMHAGCKQTLTEYRVGPTYDAKTWTRNFYSDTWSPWQRCDLLPGSHIHDERYYTEGEVDTKLSGKANASHTHDTSDFTPALIAALKGSTGATGPQGPAGEAQQIVVGGNYTVQVVSAIPTTPAANVIYFISL